MAGSLSSNSDFYMIKRLRVPCSLVFKWTKRNREKRREPYFNKTKLVKTVRYKMRYKSSSCKKTKVVKISENKLSNFVPGWDAKPSRKPSRASPKQMWQDSVYISEWFVTKRTYCIHYMLYNTTRGWLLTACSKLLTGSWIQLNPHCYYCTYLDKLLMSQQHRQ